MGLAKMPLGGVLRKRDPVAQQSLVGVPYAVHMRVGEVQVGRDTPPRGVETRADRPRAGFNQ